MIFFSSTNKSVTKQPFFNFVLCRNADDCCRVIIHTPMTQHNLLLVCYLFVDKNFFFGLCFVLLPPSLSLSVVCIIPKSLLLKILSRNLLLCVYFVLNCWTLFCFFFLDVSRSWEGGLLPMDEEGHCQRHSEARSGAQKSEEGERRCGSHHPTQKINS